MTDDTLRALYVLAADYHSGQWSRCYRLLSRLVNLLHRRNAHFETILGTGADWDAIRQSAAYAKYQPLAERYF